MTFSLLLLCCFVLFLVLVFFLFFFFFFFFSSRRRHTRSTRDWSSDVCSSDLLSMPSSAIRFSRRSSTSSMLTLSVIEGSFGKVLATDYADCAARSEERRVGKECRSRW